MQRVLQGLEQVVLGLMAQLVMEVEEEARAVARALAHLALEELERLL